MFISYGSRSNARYRLFAFPFAGGGPAAFLPWLGDVGCDVEVRYAMLPGRGALLSEPALSNSTALLDMLFGAISREMDKPYVLFGHSMGGLLSFALAQKIARAGLRGPQFVVLSAISPPHIEAPRRQLHSLSDDEFINELRLLNGTPPELLEDTEFMDLMLPTLRADFTVCETHTWETTKLACPLLVLGGTQDLSVPTASLAEWRSYSNSDTTIHSLPGDHFFIHQQGEVIARTVASLLRQQTLVL